MKKIHLAGNLLKVMLLGSMLAGCQNQDQDLVTPAEKAAISEDANAKTSELVKKLVEDGDLKLVYFTSGRDLGRLSAVIEPGGAFTTYYSYSNGADSDLWITVKRKNNSTGSYTSHISYHVLNGKCVKSTDITNNKSLIYQYNESGRLDAVLQEGSTEKREFTYYYNAAADAERLTKITYSNASGKWKEVTFLYGTGNGVGSGAPKQDKYLLNPEHTEFDPYLPIFGRFSDVLVNQVTVTPLPDIGQSKPFFIFTYILNASGYVMVRYKATYPLGMGNTANATTKISNQKYGYPGQGI